MFRVFASLLLMFSTGLAASTSSEPPQPAKPSEPAVSEPAPATTPTSLVTPGADPAVSAPVAPKITFSQCHVDGPYIAITFDDGPHGKQTPRLLKMLKDRGIHATFFVLGQNVAEFPEIVRQIAAEGHEIGSHSWDHPLLTKLSQESVHSQLQRTDDVLQQVLGTKIPLFRPPYGAFTPTQRAWANATYGYKIILWDVDSLDWQHRNPAKTQSIIMANTRPGSIILCHDIHSTTVDAMPATLDALLAKGFKFVTVSELMKMHTEVPVAQKPKAPVRSLSVKEGANAVISLDEVQKPAHKSKTR